MPTTLMTDTTLVPTASELTGAVIRREFVPLYEPVVDVRSGAVLGWDAVAHWVRPDGDLVQDAHYGAVASDAGLRTFIDAMVVDRALRRFRRWSGGTMPATGPWLSFTLDADRLGTGALAGWLLDVVGLHRIPPSRLLLTVRGFADGAARTEAVDELSWLRERGISVAADLTSSPVAHLDLRDHPVDVARLGIDDGAAYDALAGLGWTATIVGGVASAEHARRLSFLGATVACGAALAPIGEDFADCPRL